MNAAAPREQLQELHRLLCGIFLDYLRTTPPERRRASMLEVIRSFLRDNGIQKDMTLQEDVQTSLESLADMDIPFFSN